MNTEEEEKIYTRENSFILKLRIRMYVMIVWNPIFPVYASLATAYILYETSLFELLLFTLIL